jgi:glycosyltransferase involved in cell wall biosynthesis
MKNVIIISYSYPPSNAPAAQRPYALTKYLDKSKFEVTVITCSNADSSLGYDPNFDETLDQVDLIKIKSRFGTNASKFRDSGMADKKAGLKANIKKLVLSLITYFILPDKAMFWYPNVIKYLKKEKKLLEEADVVFTTSPLFSNHLVGSFIKKKKNSIKWIADFRDFHYAENWSMKNGIRAKYHQRLEQKIIMNADGITFISSAMQVVYESHYNLYQKKMHHVYNGFDLDDFKNLPNETLKNEKLTIFYAGSFYKGVRSPLPLLTLLDDAFSNNYLNPDEVVIKIAGNFEQELLIEAKRFKSFSCVEFLGRIPRTEVLERLTKADLLWLIVGDKITHYTGVPIKFYEYLAARRPILNFAPNKSEPTKIIEKYNLGVSFDSTNNDWDTNTMKFGKLILAYKNGTLQKPLNPSSVTQFTRETQALIFQELFE